ARARSDAGMPEIGANARQAWENSAPDYIRLGCDAGFAPYSEVRISGNPGSDGLLAIVHRRGTTHGAALMHNQSSILQISGYMSKNDSTLVRSCFSIASLLPSSTGMVTRSSRPFFRLITASPICSISSAGNSLMPYTRTRFAMPEIVLPPTPSDRHH